MPISDDYEALLARARQELPESTSTHERFEIPEPDVLYEGKTTVFRNFGDIADKLNREMAHLQGFLLKELGTAGALDARRIIFKSRLTPKQIMDRLEDYAKTYVICTECNRPDTQLIKDGRTLVLDCTACGAHRPVRVRKASRSQAAADEVQEGEVYTLTITGTGRKGDGIVKKGRLIVYVNGAKKGQTVKVKIDKISGSVAFGYIV
jgi:translation initiation factor 2 subunit 2